MVDQRKTIIEILNLETRFRNKTIHKDLSLEVYDGETIALLGGSGSGKSTLMRLLVGLERAYQGRCFFEGKDLFQISEQDWKEVRRRIAYVFQGGALFDSLTVAENLSYPLEEHGLYDKDQRTQRIGEVLTSLGLEGTESLLPSALSGGMQKRVGLARALILNPELVLYDEPTAGLDPTNSRIIVDTIRTLQAKGKTSILVTHDTTFALKAADRMLLILDGRIAVNQTAQDYEYEPNPTLKAFIDGEFNEKSN